MTLPASVPGLGIADYVVFVVVLVTPLLIGAYHAVTGNKTTEDFLMAGRSMNPIPVSLSMTATFISSIAILGLVGEVYGHGLLYMWSVIGSFVGMVIAILVFNPIFYPLHLSSVNEYIELRFRSPALRKLVLFQSCLSILLYLGLCLFAPTLALEAVTPISSGTYILVLGTIVTLYCSFGGLKTVVWTDAFQTAIIVLGVIFATIAAVVQLGGFGEVWRIATEHNRTQTPNTGFGFYERHTIFSAMWMNGVNYLYFYSFNQTTIQRMETMPNYKRAKQLLYMNLANLMFLLLLLFATGLCIFSVFADCDPITQGYIERKDQIFPFYVMVHLGFLKGVPGLFIGCLFSGTMSSISSMLNSLPTMLWNDVLSDIPYFVRASERAKTLTNKLNTFLLGVVMIGLAFFSSKMGGLTQATATLLSVISGPTLGVFLLGVCVPICSKKGAMIGYICSIMFMAWMGIGSWLHGMKTEMLPLSIEGCPEEFLNSSSSTSTLAPSHTTVAVTDSTTLATDVFDESHPLANFYGLSYTFFSTIGSLSCVLVGVIASLVTGLEKMEEIDPKLVLPCLRKFVGKKDCSSSNVEITKVSKLGKDALPDVRNGYANTTFVSETK